MRPTTLAPTSRKRMRLRLVFVLGVLASAGLARADPAGHVVLIGVDGASWNVIDPLIAKGELPHLADLIARGVHADLETVEPVISPTVWTSIATGRSPAEHGITSFWSHRRRVPTVFERLAARGRRVGLYDYLVTWPPSALPQGFVIPGWLRRDARVTPPDVWERAGAAPFVIDYDTPRTSRDYLEQSRREVALKAARWNALARAFRVEVGAVTFYTPDTRSHRWWLEAFPSDFEEPGPPAPPELRDAIADGYRGVDRSIGEIVATLGPDDVVLIASDHGFEAGEGVGNVWITRDEALPVLHGDPGVRVAGTFGAVAVEVAQARTGDGTEGFAARDRAHTAIAEAFGSCRSASGEQIFDVYRLDVAARPAGFERGLLDRAYQWIVRRVLSYAFGIELDPTLHGVVIARPRDATLAPLWPEGLLRVGDRELAVSDLFDRQQFSGRHNPTAVLIVAGGPIVRRTERTRASVLDIAPLVFWLAGEAIPDDLEGGVPRDWLDPAALRARPVEIRPAAELPELPRRDAGVDSPEELEQLEEKLRGLGYVE